MNLTFDFRGYFWVISLTLERRREKEKVKEIFNLFGEEMNRFVMLCTVWKMTCTWEMRALEQNGERERENKNGLFQFVYWKMCVFVSFTAHSPGLVPIRVFSNGKQISNNSMVFEYKADMKVNLVPVPPTETSLKLCLIHRMECLEKCFHNFKVI